MTSSSKLSRRGGWTTDVLVIIVVAFCMILPQVNWHGMILGVDVVFHYNRIYDAYMQLKTGHFNFYQSLYGYQKSGRIVNAVYGSGSAYVGGALLLLVKSWFKFQLVTGFLCELVAGLSMYRLMKHLPVRNWIALAVAIMYMSTSVVDTWVLGQSFGAWGAALLPLVLTAAVDVVKSREANIQVLWLATGMAALVMTHLVSTLFGVLALIPFFCVGLWRARDRMVLIVRVIFAAVLAVLLAAPSLFGILEVEKSNLLITPWKNTNMLASTADISTGDNAVRTVGLILSAICLFTIVYVVVTWSKRTVLARMLVLVGGAFLLLASAMVPWNDVSKMSSGIAGLQFPARFIVIALILLLAGFGLVLESFKLESENANALGQAIVITAALLLVIPQMLLIGQSAARWRTAPASGDNQAVMVKMSPDQLRKAWHSSDLSKGLQTFNKPNSDYLPLVGVTNQDAVNGYDEYQQQVLANPLKVKKTVTAAGELKLTWTNAHKTTVTLPVVIYNHSTVVMDGHHIAIEDVKRTSIGVMKVKATAGKHSVVVGYQPKINTRVTVGLQIVGLVILVGAAVWRLYRRLRRQTHRKARPATD